LAAIATLVILALSQTAATPAPTPSQPTPLPPTLIPQATRVPLPTLGPPMVISRTARETPTPGPSPTPSSVPRVAVIDNGYAPSVVTVGSGTTVLWVNSGGDGHDVTGRGPDGAWRSGPLAPGDRYQRAFYMDGAYDYVCTVHPEMRGRVVVQP
jgi:plastocyanin